MSMLDRRLELVPVTVWTEQWRAAGKIITPDAIETVAATIVRDFTSGSRSDGSGRLRPSGIGNVCARAQVFSYLGVKQKAKNPEYEEMADAGSWLHYKWQAEGLSGGWLEDIEVPVEIPEWGLRGAMDGICKDGSIFEAKTVGTDKFMGRRQAPPVDKWAEPSKEHVRQVYAYMHSQRIIGANCTAASIVYIDRDSNKFREFRINWDQDYFDTMNTFVMGMVDSIARKELPQMVSPCVNVMNGQAEPWEKRTFNFCDYSEHCQTAEWSN